VTKVDDILQHYGITAADLRGAVLTAEIPLTDAVVNRLIAQQLAARETPFADVQVEALEDDRFTARVSAKARMVPAMSVFARIERQPDFPGDPVLWLRWSGLGALSRLAGPAIAFFQTTIAQKLPPGIMLDGKRVGIDVRRLLVERGLDDLADYARTVRVSTRRGAFVVKVELRAA
jgi:hypothetical protein